MLKQMKQQITESLHKARERGQLTSQEVYELTHESVLHSAQSLKKGAKDLREITHEAVTAAVQSLQEAGEASRDKIAASLHGAIDAVKHVESQMLETADKELAQAKARLVEEEKVLAQKLREALEGAEKAASDFSGEVKADMESAVTDIKLKGAELLGLTRESIKAAVKQTIETGTKVEETVAEVTRDATKKALTEARFSAERARKISESVLSAAVEAAEELGSHVKEVSGAAANGVHEGLIHVVDETQHSLKVAGGRFKEFAIEDLEQTKQDLELVGNLFVETLHKVAARSSDAAKETLNELAEDAQKAGTSLRKKSIDAAHKAGERLKKLGSEAAHKTAEASGKAAQTLAEEAKELGERMLAIAKGAATGMWEGAKEALHEEKEKGNKS